MLSCGDLMTQGLQMLEAMMIPALFMLIMMTMLALIHLVMRLLLMFLLMASLPSRGPYLS